MSRSPSDMKAKKLLFLTSDGPMVGLSDCPEIESRRGSC